MALIIDNTTADELSRVIALALTDGYLEIYGPSVGETAPLLSRIRLPMAAFVADQTNGGWVKSGNWFGTVRETGIATTFKIKAYEGNLSVTGVVSDSLGNGDLILNSTSLTYGQLITISACRITFRSA